MRLNEFSNKIFTTYSAYMLGLVTILGLALRLYNIDSDFPLWSDEAFSVWFTGQSWHYLWNEVPKFETHPPFYYSLLKIWRAFFGSDEIALRSLSALVSTLVIPLVYASARLLLKDQSKALALLAAIIAAVWWPQIECARSARPYAFTTFTMAFLLPCFVYAIVNMQRFSFPRPIEFRENGPTILAIIGLAIGLSLLQWFHNLGILYNVSIGLALVCGWLFIGRARFSILMSIVVIGILAAVLYVPNIPNLLMQSKMINNHFWIKEPGMWDIANNFSIIYGLPLYLAMPKPPMAWMGSTFMWYNALAVAFALLVAFAALFIHLRKQYSLPSALIIGASIALVVFMPTVLSLLVTFTFTPIFLDRTLLATQVPLFIAYACIPFIFKGMAKKFAVILIILVPLMWSASKLYVEERGPIQNERGMKDIIEMVGTKNSLGATVFVYPNYLEFLASYYADRNSNTLNLIPIPAAYPVIDSPEYEYPYGGAVPFARIKDIDSLLNQKEHQSAAWLISRGLGLYDPEGKILEHMSSYYLCSQLMYGEKGSLQLRFFSNDPKVCRNRGI